MKRQCSVKECQNKYHAKGFCRIHYQLNRKYGKPEYKIRIIKKCSVDRCNRKHYAKNLCHVHQELKRRNGLPMYAKDILRNCVVPSCNNKITLRNKSNFCSFHMTRLINDTPLLRPKGIKGELNPRWNGGVSEYPNHYQMKKIRKEKEILKRDNYTCYFCGKPTNQIHHLDGSKDNHSAYNLVACCQTCNMFFAKPHTSKYEKLYGCLLKDMPKLFPFFKGTYQYKSHDYYYQLHQQGLLSQFIKDQVQGAYI